MPNTLSSMPIICIQSFFFDFATINGLSDVDAYIIKLKNLGYIAIKIHPRIANIAFDHPLLKEAIVAANRHGLGVLLCTYFWNACGLATNIEELVKLLVQVPDQKIVLLHGGAVRLLEVTEIVRQFPNALLDLSLTLCKYEGSSLDMDIQFLFNQFDRRICIGSDSPEFDHAALRRRFDYFSTKLDTVKARNIAYKNLMKHLNINDPD